MTAKKRTGFTTIIGVALVLIFGSGSSVLSAQSDWDQIVEKAKQEGQVVLYGTIGQEEAFPGIAKILREKYNIKADMVRLRGGQAISKMKAEMAASSPIASFMCSGASVPLSNLNLFQPIGKLPEVQTGKFPIDPHVYGDSVISVAVSPTGIITNTNLVPKGTEPKTWKELADPKWKRKFVVQDPRKPGLPPALFAFLVNMYGEDWYKQVLIDNDPFITREGKWTTPEVVRGEYPMFIAGIYRYLHVIMVDQPSVPAIFSIPEEGTYSSFTTFGILKNAPHPNAARVFLNVALSMEGQAACAKEGYVPVRSGVKLQFPQFQNPDNLKNLEPYPATIKYFRTNFKKAMDLSKKLMGK